jgi:hypothetical protein
MDEASDVVVVGPAGRRLTLADFCYAMLTIKLLKAENADLRRELEEARDARRPGSDRD